MKCEHVTSKNALRKKAFPSAGRFAVGHCCFASCSIPPGLAIDALPGLHGDKSLTRRHLSSISRVPFAIDKSSANPLFTDLGGERIKREAGGEMCALVSRDAPECHRTFGTPLLRIGRRMCLLLFLGFLQPSCVSGVQQIGQSRGYASVSIHSRPRFGLQFHQFPRHCSTAQSWHTSCDYSAPADCFNLEVGPNIPSWRRNIGNG